MKSDSADKSCSAFDSGRQAFSLEKAGSLLPVAALSRTEDGALTPTRKLANSTSASLDDLHALVLAVSQQIIALDERLSANYFATDHASRQMKLHLTKLFMRHDTDSMGNLIKKVREEQAECVARDAADIVASVACVDVAVQVALATCDSSVALEEQIPREDQSALELEQVHASMPSEEKFDERQDPPYKLWPNSEEVFTTPRSVTFSPTDEIILVTRDVSNKELVVQPKLFQGDVVVPESRSNKCNPGGINRTHSELIGLHSHDRQLDQLHDAFVREGSNVIEDQKEAWKQKRRSWHIEALAQVKAEQATWHRRCPRISRFLPKKPPVSRLTKITSSWVFGSASFFATLFNAVIIGCESDLTMQGLLMTPPQGPPIWVEIAHVACSFFFLTELIIRLMASRVWFFVDPVDWRWNWIDVIVVLSSFISIFGPGSSLTMMRMLRVFKLVRVAKIVGKTSAFDSLRHIMLSLMACFQSLCWGFLFLATVVFCFSILFLNAAAVHIEENGNRDNIRDTFREYYNSVPTAMFYLLAAVSGGTDWLAVMEPVGRVSVIYKGAFAFFVVFIILGVFNVMTAVFMSAATAVPDRALTVKAEKENLQSFVTAMLDLFNEIHPNHDGNVMVEQFEEFLANSDVEAYLSSHMLETAHPRLLFQLLDQDGTGTMGMEEFVIGLGRLKGEAKTYDSRVLLHEVCKVMDSIHLLDNKCTALLHVQSGENRSAHS